MFFVGKRSIRNFVSAWQGIIPPHLTLYCCIYFALATEQGHSAKVSNAFSKAKKFYSQNYQKGLQLPHQINPNLQCKSLQLLADYFSVSFRILKRAQQNKFVELCTVSSSRDDHPCLSEIVLLYSEQDQRFALVTNYSALTSRYFCKHCFKQFANRQSARRHEKLCSSAMFLRKGGYRKKPVNRYKKGKYIPTRFIIERLENLGLEIADRKAFFCPYLIIIDSESFLKRHNIADAFRGYSDTVFAKSATSVHETCAISVCSTIPGYEEPVVFVKRPTGPCFITETLQYLLMLSDKQTELMQERVQHVVEQLDELIKFHERKKNSPFLQHVQKVKRELEAYLQTTSVFWYNMGYDWGVLKRTNFCSIWKSLEASDIKIIKKSTNNYLLVQSMKLRFMDILSFFCACSA